MNKNIGDMSKEELYELCNELLDKDTDYMLLERKIDKAIEYIKQNNCIAVNKEYLPKEYEWCCSAELLEILGDKEND